MEDGQFFCQITKEEVTWSKVWDLDRMGQALSCRGLNTLSRLLGIAWACIIEMDEE
jgi:hypothetical protein